MSVLLLPVREAEKRYFLMAVPLSEGGGAGASFSPKILGRKRLSTVPTAIKLGRALTKELFLFGFLY